jgi:hypothetical protein
MRETLAAMHADIEVERGPGARIDLHALVHDLLEGEVEAPTADVAHLLRRGVDPDEFYEHEIAPSWDGLDREQRAARLDGFFDLTRMLDDQLEQGGLPPDVAAVVHTKTLLLAWAFDETYGYVGQIVRGEIGALRT